MLTENSVCTCGIWLGARVLARCTVCWPAWLNAAAVVMPAAVKPGPPRKHTFIYHTHTHTTHTCVVCWVRAAFAAWGRCKRHCFFNAAIQRSLSAAPRRYIAPARPLLTEVMKGHRVCCYLPTLAYLSTAVCKQLHLFRLSVTGLVSGGRHNLHLSLHLPFHRPFLPLNGRSQISTTRQNAKSPLYRTISV